MRFEHFFEDGENVYILLELCENQTLNDLLKRRKTLHELEVAYYMRQVVEALRYLHSQNIMHRDLKLGNLLLNKMQIKVGDFGLACQLKHFCERRKTVCGTTNYIAPEVVELGGQECGL